MVAATDLKSGCFGGIGQPFDGFAEIKNCYELSHAVAAKLTRMHRHQKAALQFL